MAQQRSTTVVLVVAALALAGYAFWSNLAPKRGGAPSSSPASEAAEREEPDARGPRGALKLGVSPASVDLGTLSQCGSVATFEAVLRNEGQDPLTVTGWSSTSGAIEPIGAIGGLIEPSGERKIRVRVEPWGYGPKQERLDFRIDGRRAGGSVSIGFTIAGGVRSRPGVVIRPERTAKRAIDIERVGPDGEFLAQPFMIMAVTPPVADIYDTEQVGLGVIDIDFAAIDELAAEASARENPAFEFIETPRGWRWTTFELVVRTDVEGCAELRVRVKNN